MTVVTLSNSASLRSCPQFTVCFLQILDRMSEQWQLSEGAPVLASMRYAATLLPRFATYTTSAVGSPVTERGNDPAGNGDPVTGASAPRYAETFCAAIGDFRTCCTESAYLNNVCGNLAQAYSLAYC